MRGIIQKIETSHAHILLDDGQVLHVPVSELDSGVRVTSVVNVRVQDVQQNSADGGDNSRQKLNDILSSRPE
ncbi:MAG: hypothetical protein AAB445_04335 [Patescibacteria group bacterium]